MLNLHDNTGHLSRILSEAWLHRVAQELDQCRTLVAEIRIALGLPLGRLEISSVSGKLERNGTSVDAVCLVASIARADRQYTYSQEILFALDQLVSDAGFPRTFRLSQELGHTFFLRGDFASAVNQYFAAKSLSKNPRETYQAAINALLCLENMGLPLEDTKAAAAAALAEFKDTAKKEEAGPLELFYARKNFRAGQIAAALEILSQPDVPMLAEYDRHYIKSLPYHSSYDPCCHRADESWNEKTRGLFLRDYRYRTLVGLTHPDDDSSIKPQEVAERVYLWLWRWLVTEGEFPVHKLLIQLSHALTAEPAFLTENDRHLLVVSMAWFELLDSGAAKYLRRIRTDLELSAPSGPSLLALEYLGICQLILVRDGKKHEARDVEKQLASHPLWTSKEIKLPLLFSLEVPNSATNKQGELMVRLRNALNVFGKAVDSEKKYELKVNLASNEIYARGLENSIISKPLALALAAISDQESISLQNLLFQSFQIQNYDSVIHDSKIYNILARLKKIIPKTLKIRVKEGRVFKTGPWNLVQIDSLGPLAASLTEDNLWQTLLARKSPVGHGNPGGADPQQNYAINSNTKEFGLLAATICNVGERLTRDDFQTRFNLKRSTANRFLVGWEKAGQIRRLGTGRSTAYIVKKILPLPARNLKISRNNDGLDEL